MGFGAADQHGLDGREAVRPARPRPPPASRTGDRLVSLDGQPVAGFDAVRQGRSSTAPATRSPSSCSATASAVTLHPTIGWVLTDTGAAKLAPLEPVTRSPRSARRPTATLRRSSRARSGRLRRARPASSSSATATRYRTTVPTPVALPANGAAGLPRRSRPRRGRAPGADCRPCSTAGSQFVGLISGSVGALGRFFSPSGPDQLDEATWSATRAPSSSSTSSRCHRSCRSARARRRRPPTSRCRPARRRTTGILSVFGVLRLGSQAGGAGAAVVLFLLALINIFLGLLNLVPLPPFDGGPRRGRHLRGDPGEAQRPARTGPTWPS